MKNRLFSFLFISIISVVLLTSTISYFFIRSEREHLIEEQIENLSASLIASNLTLERLYQFDVTDNQISEILGEDKINHVIGIYDHDGTELYSNYTAQYLGIDFEKQTGFATEEANSHTLKILTLKTPQYYLRIGVILDEALNRWSKANFRIIIYGLIILLMGLVFSYIITNRLMKPLKDLTSYLLFLRNQVEKNPSLPLVAPIELSPMHNRMQSKKDLNPNDEWDNLVITFERLLLTLKEYSENSALRVSMLTHELKTPLTIIQNTIENLELHIQPSNESKGLLNKIHSEVIHLSKFINDFLEWSLIINQLYTDSELYAIKLDEKLHEVIAKFNGADLNRLEFSNEQDKGFLVFAQPWHVELLLSNLISNAIKYSPADKKIQIRLNNSKLSIKDEGPGISQNVLDKIGKPFNFENNSYRAQQKGSGLGLAFIDLLCKKYNWKWNINSSPQGTEIEIQFPTDLD